MTKGVGKGDYESIRLDISRSDKLEMKLDFQLRLIFGAKGTAT